MKRFLCNRVLNATNIYNEKKKKKKKKKWEKTSPVVTERLTIRS